MSSQLGGVTDNGLRSMHPFSGSRCSDFFEPGQEQPADFLFVGHPFAQRCRDCAGLLALHDLLSLVGIRRFDRLEASVNGRWSAIEDGVTAHRVAATSNR